MPTKLTDEEETGFRSWYSAKAMQNHMAEDPDEVVSDNGKDTTIDHRKFFKRIMNDPDFSEGVDNLIAHSQMNLDTGNAYMHKNPDGSRGGVSTIYTTSTADEKGVEHIFPTVWGGKIPEDDTDFTFQDAAGQAKHSKKKWPTASSPEEADEIANWVHQLVMKQKPRTPVGERALRLGL